MRRSLACAWLTARYMGSRGLPPIEKVLGLEVEPTGPDDVDEDALAGKLMQFADRFKDRGPEGG